MVRKRRMMRSWLVSLSPPSARQAAVRCGRPLGYPFLLGPALAGSPQPGDPAAHQAGTARLEQIIRRGQRAGDFDRTLPAAWLAGAIVGLVRPAAEQVAAGRLTTSKAAALALDSTLRLCGAAAPAVRQERLQQRLPRTGQVRSGRHGGPPHRRPITP
jgi:hypothetical protein